MNIIKIIKINLLSLFIIFLFLMAFIAKLSEIIIKKLVLLKYIILSIIFFIAIYQIIYYGFIYIYTYLFIIIAMSMCVILSAIFSVVKKLLYISYTLTISILIFLWYGLSLLFNKIFNLCYSGTLKLKYICKRDLEFISLSGNNFRNSFCCIFYYLSEGIKKLINIVSLGVIAISIIFSGGCAVLLGVLANNYSENKLNINIFQTFQQLNNVTRILNASAYLIIVIGILIITMTIGSDLRTWAKELYKPIKLNNEINIDNKNEEISKIKNREEFNKYKSLLYNNIQDIEKLSLEIDKLFKQNKDTELIVSWNEYLRNIIEVSSVFEMFNKKDKVSTYSFKILIPKIKLIQRQHEDLIVQIEKLKEKNKDILSQAIFFSGCDTLEKLERRHRILSKAYHPDVGGDEATFVKMQNEYEDLKSVFAKEENFCNV